MTLARTGDPGVGGAFRILNIAHPLALRIQHARVIRAWLNIRTWRYGMLDLPSPRSLVVGRARGCAPEPDYNTQGSSAFVAPLGPGTLFHKSFTGSRGATGPESTYHTIALASVWDIVDGFAFRITLPARCMRALLVGDARPATPVNTEITAAPPVRFTTLPVSFMIGPDRSASPSIAKSIAALVLLRAAAL
jgi:hypothetical protein